MRALIKPERLVAGAGSRKKDGAEVLRRWVGVEISLVGHRL